MRSKGPRIYGPKRVPANRQVALPSDLMREVELIAGDEIYFLAWQGRVLIVRETEVAQRLEGLFRDIAVGDPD
jgi:hypothetical protein